MQSKRYDEERLGRLLSLLRAAPRGWIDRAQRIPVAERQIEELERMLDGDETFRRSFDLDPVAAAGNAGMDDLALDVQRELDALLSEEVLAHRANRMYALLLRSEAVRERLGL
jgi:hypothetical protein